MTQKIVKEHTLDPPAPPEALVFALRDNYQQFSLGLSTVLECLAAAEREAHVPELPEEWWAAARNQPKTLHIDDANESDVHSTEAEIFSNRAVFIEAVDHTDCEDCEETMLFVMRDNHHEFCLGLTTLLGCLAIAEHDKYTPPLPEHWWATAWRR